MDFNNKVKKSINYTQKGFHIILFLEIKLI